MDILKLGFGFAIGIGIMVLLMAYLVASLWNSWNWYLLAAKADPNQALIYLFISFGLCFMGLTLSTFTNRFVKGVKTND